MSELQRQNARRFVGWTPPGPVDAFKDSQFDQKSLLWPSGTKYVGKPVGHKLFPYDPAWETGDEEPRYSFDSCNLINTQPPPGSTLTHCNTALIERGVLVKASAGVADVAAGLAHEVGQPIYGHRVWGKWTPEGYEYTTPAGVTPDVVPDTV